MGFKQKVDREHLHGAGISTSTSQRGALWAFLNSSFFLWLAGSIMLSTFATVYSEVQLCHSNVHSAQDRFVSAALELKKRLHKFMSSVADSKNVGELRATIEKFRTSSSFVYSKFEKANIEEVGLEWARSLAELQRYEEAATSAYKEKYSHTPEMYLTKQIAYGVDLPDDQLLDWQKVVRKSIEDEKNLIQHNPSAVFEINYPQEIEAVENAEVCTWRDVVKRMIFYSSDD